MKKGSPMSEHLEQKAFFEWLDRAKIPGTELAHAIPNGGHRHPAVAAKLKAEGVKPGVPDVSIPVSRGGWIGLAIEFKHGDGAPSKQQRDRINKMQLEGWCVVVCWSWESARRVVIGYFGLTEVSINVHNQGDEN